jgi:reactive chlorine resistance protein C
MATGSPQPFRAVDQRLLLGGGNIIRYGLVVVIVWIGALKFTGSEAARIQPFIEHSPFMSWLNGVFSVRALAAVLGTIEIAAAVLIALRPWLPLPSAVGSAVATLLFLGTLSFLFTTPGVTDAAAGGFPALSSVGQFLLKDLVLLGASVWTLGESLQASAATVDGRSRPTRLRRSPTDRATASR